MLQKQTQLERCQYDYGELVCWLKGSNTSDTMLLPIWYSHGRKNKTNSRTYFMCYSKHAEISLDLRDAVSNVLDENSP
jgi:hypothetical protein